jgi:nitroimidazol reductase NimA-like FMN-containing flavoprotein (pyridoxamine 5'-phosphate oxidase superfamily)
MTMPDGLDEPAEPAYVRTLPEEECYKLLGVSTVGRIGSVSSGGVQILPVGFRLGDGHRLFMRTSPDGTVARLARDGASVGFEVDYHANDFGIAWSVLMNGTVSFLDSAATEAYARLRLPPVPWPGLPDSVAIQFVPQTISGRGLHRH